MRELLLKIIMENYGITIGEKKSQNLVWCGLIDWFKQI